MPSGGVAVDLPVWEVAVGEVQERALAVHSGFEPGAADPFARNS